MCLLRRRATIEHLPVHALYHPHVRVRLDLGTYLAQEHRRGLSAEDFELSRHNLRRRVRLRCQNYFAACRVVSETDFVLTMPRRYAGILNAQFANRLLPFPPKVPAFDTYIYWHANSDRDPANEWLRQELFRALRDRASSERSNC
jgi:DNA-binding transcriptional LysR family regulator